jgi:hypothetical protein
VHRLETVTARRRLQDGPLELLATNVSSNGIVGLRDTHRH